MVEAARRSQAAGATEFCIVVAVRGPDERLLDRTLEATAAIKRETRMQVACSLGLLDDEQARRLAEGGIDRYNHNLEAARSFFPEICTSHSFDDRYETCLRARAAGMELCSGGIVGMGETWEQRVELAYDLASLDPDEVPLNFLNPRPGTPLEERELVEPLEALKAIALFRLVLPRATLRYAGGREVDAARAAGARARLGHQRADRRQLPDDARAQRRGRPAHARRSAHAAAPARRSAVTFCPRCGSDEHEQLRARRPARPAALLRALRAPARGAGAPRRLHLALPRAATRRRPVRRRPGRAAG